MALEQTINTDIKAAMIAKDSVRLRGLRAIKAAILLAKTEKAIEALLRARKCTRMAMYIAQRNTL